MAAKSGLGKINIARNRKAVLNYNSIVVLGHTAAGKTALACYLAKYLKGEIISADSRQVYRELNLGTGKDLNEYVVDGLKIPYHLIDIADPQEQFFVHQFAEALAKAFLEISSRGCLPVICGGTGLYLDVLHKDFSLTQIGENQALRETLINLTKEELLRRLDFYPTAHTKHVDRDSLKRIIRGIEIAEFRSKNELAPAKVKMEYRPLYLGLAFSVEDRKKRIQERLLARLEAGLVEEVESLVKKGLEHKRLQELGLEYKFVSQYIQQKISREEMITLLQTAIVQYAKRQMTWFRKMEKEGIKIHWLNQGSPAREALQIVESELGRV